MKANDPTRAVGSNAARDASKVNVYLDRLPAGGFSGRVHLVKTGEQPPAPEPDRPARRGDDHDGDEADLE